MMINIALKEVKNMEFIEFVEKFTEENNIVLLPHQKRTLTGIDKAIKDRKKIKIACLKNSGASLYKELSKAYFDDEMKEVKDDETTR